MIDISALSLYNDDRNSQEVDIMFLLESNERIGEYLRSLIEDREKLSITDFCKKFLTEKYSKVNYTEDNLKDELKTTKNTFSKILSGKQGVTLEQLSILSKLLSISCEEILSAGKHYAPTRNHITNYDIAQSHDREVWDEYMKREDTIFLNCDEYCKTVIDYALEFKNYAFMKYLLDEGFIWFVDPNADVYDMYGYRAGTSIKPKELAKSHPENRLPTEIQFQDRLRTQTIALAIETEDYDILESLRAREIPEMHTLTWNGINPDFYKSENLIEAIANSENEKIIDYFSDEFTIMSINNKELTVVFPFLSDVIEYMLKIKNEKAAETALKKAIFHNKSTFNKINDMIKRAFQLYHDSQTEQMERLIKVCTETGCSVNDANMIKRFKENADNYSHIYSTFNVDKYNYVSFYYRDKGQYSDIITNICKVTNKNGTPEIKKLIEELNEWYNKIISLGGERYAEILL